MSLQSYIHRGLHEVADAVERVDLRTRGNQKSIYEMEQRLQMLICDRGGSQSSQAAAIPGELEPYLVRMERLMEEFSVRMERHVAAAPIWNQHIPSSGSVCPEPIPSFDPSLNVSPNIKPNPSVEQA